MLGTHRIQNNQPALLVPSLVSKTLIVDCKGFSVARLHGVVGCVKEFLHLGASPILDRNY